MIILLIVFSLIYSPLIIAQPPISSQVYRWADAAITTSDSLVHRHYLSGSTRDLAQLELSAITLASGQLLPAFHPQEPAEKLIIIKEGNVKITIKGEAQVLGPGSVALIMPDDQYRIGNAGPDSASLYCLRYTAKSQPNPERARQAGGSLVMNWQDIPFQERDKGGVRSFFERPTAMLERLEMHVTTLNPGVQSHPPHTHRPAEIILMLEGESQELIDGQYYRGEAGDLYFLGSESQHTIKNTGNRPCTYFAFQFH